jgi:hypothetical protein
MAVRQLEEFLGQADQKGFWIFSYANLGGAFFGAFAGNSLMENSTPALKLPAIAIGVLLGVLVTWKLKGHPIYRWALSYLAFLLRRYLKVGLGDSVIDAGMYYRSRAVRQEPFMLVTTKDGKPVPVLVHKGSGTGSPTGLLDGLFLPARGEKKQRSGEHRQPVAPIPISMRSERRAVPDPLSRGRDSTTEEAVSTPPLVFSGSSGNPDNPDNPENCGNADSPDSLDSQNYLDNQDSQDNPDYTGWEL